MSLVAESCDPPRESLCLFADVSAAVGPSPSLFAWGCLLGRATMGGALVYLPDGLLDSYPSVLRAIALWP